MRVLYGERREALIESLRKAFGFGVDIVGGQAGMHLSMTLKNVRDRQVALQAAKENLWLVPLSTSYLQRPLRQGFILGFGSTRTLEMPAAVQKLKSLIAKSC
jgi:GntR family transcriptional regulator / MocR family aminotransferase